jgi:hypothetical protein
MHLPMVTHIRLFAPLALLLSVVTFAMPVHAQLIPRLKPKPLAGPAPSAVVLDFSVSPRVSEARECCTRRITYEEKDVKTEKDSRGWWLGRQDIWVNSNVGRMAADLMSDQLQADCVYKLRSRGDLKYYYADKKDLIKKKFPNMSSDEVKKSILLLDPVSIGREMGVQKVIVGHICDSELRKAVAPGSFASVASFSVAVFDVASGQIEFQQCYSKIRNHSTQYFHYEKIAEEVSHDIMTNRVGIDTTQAYQQYQR